VRFLPKKPVYPASWSESEEPVDESDEGNVEELEKLDEVIPEELEVENKSAVDWIITNKKNEEQSLREEIAGLEQKAEERKMLGEQKHRIKELKGQIRKEKVSQAVAPITDVVKPVAKEAKKIGKGFYNFGKAFVKRSKERAQERAVTGGVGEGAMGTQKPSLGFGSKVGLTVREGRPEPFIFGNKIGGTSLTLGKASKVDLTVGRKGGGALDMTKKNRVELNTVLSKKKEYDFSFGRNFGVSSVKKKGRK
jgi:hypothetical protein